jgi:hypothetical protein
MLHMILPVLFRALRHFNNIDTDLALKCHITRLKFKSK